MKPHFKSGFIGLVGPTNSGKSTLLNALVGEKVSIVSPKVQTTYHKVCGIVHEPEDQLVFVDVPGFQRYEESVARLLNRVADRGASECDLHVWVFDASSGRVLEQVEKLKQRIDQIGKPGKRLLVLNKVDKVRDKKELLPVMAALHSQKTFDEVIPVSALKKDGLENLLSAVRSRLSEGPAYFPPDQHTDRSEKFLVTEFIRERIYRETTQEMPYAVRVEVETWETPDNKEGRVPVIRAVIHIDSPSRKKIMIGRGGSLIKKVGVGARKEIEQMLGYEICLKLFVDVEDSWKSDERLIGEYLELK